MLKKLGRAAAVIAAAALMLSGCGKKAEETSGYTLNEYTAAGDIIEGRKNIYLIVKNISNSYWSVMLDAAKDAARDMDCNVYYSGTNNESEWEAQNELIDIALANGADALVLAPDDSVKLAGRVNELYSAGIPIVLVDTIVNTNKYDICYLTDNLMAGQEACAEMLRLLREAGISEDEPINAVIQVGSMSSQTIKERLAGICQYWSANAPKAWTLLDEVKTNEGKNDMGYSVAKEFFDEYDNIRGVFGTNNSPTIGFARYLKENELKDVAIVGFDYSDEIAALINDGDYMASTVVQNQYNMAYDGIAFCLDRLNGIPYNGNKLVDTGVNIVSG